MLTPDEGARILERLDTTNIEHTLLLRKIAGMVHVIEWGIWFGVLMLFLLVLERA